MTATSPQLLDQRLSSFAGGEIEAFVSELHYTTFAAFDLAQTLRNFLFSCVYRDGVGERQPIELEELNNPLGILSQPIGALKSAQVYQICVELVALKTGSSMEAMEDFPLYQFLNKTIPTLTEPETSQSRNKRRNLSDTGTDNWGWMPDGS